MKKVLWVKFGWSDFYRGGLVDGNFGWLKEKKGQESEGRGHEAFNFNPGPDGTYYCYVPPQNKEYAPSNPDPYGWTVVCLAKKPKYTGVHVVGWYENATLHGEWLYPPEGTIEERGNAAHLPHHCSYCITSKTAYMIPPQYRTEPFSHSSIGIGKYSFLDGPGVTITDNKKEVLKILEDLLTSMTGFAVKNPNERNLPDPQIDATDPLKGFGTSEHRKKVEKAAERQVIEHYEARGYAASRVTHLPCGYDFEFTKGRSVLHVEVKGTSSPIAQFFLTRNEHVMGMQSNPTWRLVIVTSALSDAPRVAEYDAKKVYKSFDIEPYVYIGKLNLKSES